MSYDVQPSQTLSFPRDFYCSFLKAGWDGLNVSLSPATVTSLLAPLMLAAAFIERAVEVIISPWRDQRAGRLQTASREAAEEANLSMLQANTSETFAAACQSEVLNEEQSTRNAGVALSNITHAKQALTSCKEQTKRYAYGVSLLLSFLVAYIGVRALNNLLSVPTHIQTIHQELMFNAVDVTVTAANVGGRRKWNPFSRYGVHVLLQCDLKESSTKVVSSRIAQDFGLFVTRTLLSNRTSGYASAQRECCADSTADEGEPRPRSGSRERVAAESVLLAKVRRMTLSAFALEPKRKAGWKSTPFASEVGSVGMQLRHESSARPFHRKLGAQADFLIQLRGTS